MIKLVNCLRRKQGMSVEEFRDYWRNTHGPLVQEAATALGIRRYVQNPSLHHATLEPGIRMLGYGVEPYDGIAETWWDSAESLASALMTDEGQAAIVRVGEDGSRFIDLAASAAFIVEEVEVVADEAIPGTQTS